MYEKGKKKKIMRGEKVGGGMRGKERGKKEKYKGKGKILGGKERKKYALDTGGKRGKNEGKRKREIGVQPTHLPHT